MFCLVQTGFYNMHAAVLIGLALSTPVGLPVPKVLCCQNKSQLLHLQEVSAPNIKVPFTKDRELQLGPKIN